MPDSIFEWVNIKISIKIVSILFEIANNSQK